MELKDVSLSLYHYICKHVVGTEHHVKTIRLMNTICDNLSNDDVKVYITSGSFGEGLEMRGSDLDIMCVSKDINVHEELTPLVFNPLETHFSLMTDDSNPGFAMLRLISSPHPVVREMCEQFRGEYYLSNELVKYEFLNEVSPVVHGTCLSNIIGDIDSASCLHSKQWVTSALRWTMRSNNAWPNEQTKQSIINHGVLFVPVGAKGSSHEELEWRLSFSIGEKLLIYSLNHTQLLCYVLMKIMLKDVIESDSRCKNLLCSYFLKTIIFWIFEELQPSVWRPANLIPCFMRCFRRLIYCVEYSACPHYFIPEYNLFENKIEGVDRANLINTLRVILGYGWHCILFSDQTSHFMHVLSHLENDQSYFDDINKFLKSKLFVRVCSMERGYNNFRKAVYNIITSNSDNLKYMHAYFLSAVCNFYCQSIYRSSAISNKRRYKHNNTCLSYLLMNTNYDIVSRWFMLASFFYKTNQYKKSLRIILYALSKCTNEKLFRGRELSVIHRLQEKSSKVEKQTVLRSLKFVLVNTLCFSTSAFIPMELLIGEPCWDIPPVLYAHFLSFLCHYHLGNVQECRNSLEDLKLTITEDYFMGEDRLSKSISYYYLGTALQLMGDNESAKQAFTKTVKLHPRPFFLRKMHRLSLIAT